MTVPHVLLDRLGPVCAVVGAQWGDEGKGKIIDALAPHFDVLARPCGGANAGHTVVVDGQKHVFHLLPAGCLHPEKNIVLGSGMVVHLATLLEEVRRVEALGIPIRERLALSTAAHIVLDCDRAIDAALEERRTQTTGEGIGTTRRGIGPAYARKAAREGLRCEALLWAENRLHGAVAGIYADARERYNVDSDPALDLQNLREARDFLAPHLVQPGSLLEMLTSGKRRILIEGAQGSLLDIDHGTYPFVTSSATTVAGALQGLGLPPRMLCSCIGVAKAYCTRVGCGPFPTEAAPIAAARLRERGGEYGATTGRPRRCGWLSLQDLQYAAGINGVTCWAITKLDVLDGEATIPVWSTDGSRTVHDELPGWTAAAGARTWEALPSQAQAFLRFIEERTHVPVCFIGSGSAREHLICRF